MGLSSIILASFVLGKYASIEACVPYTGLILYYGLISGAISAVSLLRSIEQDIKNDLELIPSKQPTNDTLNRSDNGTMTMSFLIITIIAFVGGLIVDRRR